jgi:hypothetical protein
MSSKIGDAVGGFAKDLGRDIFDNLTGRVYLRDWQHASKTFLPGSQGNAGKVKFTFHTYFSINEQAYQPPTGQNYGLLVKSVKLPGFNIDVETMNQYNRKRLIQSKIKYQPIDITFHDDNASQITAMWDAYYRYNYADSWNPVVDPFSTASAIKNFNRRNIYDPSISGDTEYGYRGDARGPGGDRADGGEKIPFFNNITVYGMWAGQFIAYTLVNPIITTFDHDTYDYADGGGTMQNRMTIDYETVLYNSGTIAKGDTEESGTAGSTKIPGFAESFNYDKSESPLEQGGNNPFGPYPPGGSSIGGRDIIRTASEIYNDGGKGIISSAKKAVTEGIKDAVLGALFGGKDKDTSAIFPTNGSTPAMVNIANQGKVTGANNNNTSATPAPVAGKQVTTGGGT